jgi:hypothetical protein
MNQATIKRIRMECARQQRSRAYIKGAEVGAKASEMPTGEACPYSKGSAHADAWEAGWTHGYQRARQLETAKPAPAAAAWLNA